jgi:hypothetical protein
MAKNGLRLHTRNGLSCGIAASYSFTSPHIAPRHISLSFYKHSYQSPPYVSTHVRPPCVSPGSTKLDSVIPLTAALWKSSFNLFVPNRRNPAEQHDVHHHILSHWILTGLFWTWWTPCVNSIQWWSLHLTCESEIYTFNLPTVKIRKYYIQPISINIIKQCS